MRPDPDHSQPTSQSGRVIYLGDVRRRRGAARRRGSDSHYIAALALVAVTAWAIWLTVIFTLQPARLLTYLAFFAPLWVALTATGTMIAYAVDWRMGLFPSMAVCGRRGGIAATFIVANLAILAAHLWTAPIGLISLALAVLLEIAYSRRTKY